MTMTVTARYEHGALRPLEPLDLDDGAVVRVTIVDESPTERGVAVGVAETSATYDASGPDPGGGESPLARIIANVEAAHRAMPPDAWDDVPTDLAMNKKHYLYGHPKEEDAE